MVTDQAAPAPFLGSVLGPHRGHGFGQLGIGQVGGQGSVGLLKKWASLVTVIWLFG